MFCKDRKVNTIRLKFCYHTTTSVQQYDKVQHLTFSLVYDSLHDHWEDLFVHIKQQLRRETLWLSVCANQLHTPAQPHTPLCFSISARTQAPYLIIGPFAEVNGV